MPTGTVFDIQHFCVDDGPGIRTTVFLKGCPLRCAWCHNPEGLSVTPQMFFHTDKCVLCGRCVAVCDRGGHSIVEDKHVFARENCIRCGACVAACPAEALRITGKDMTVDEVLADVLSDKPFYETSGGGLTLSGGEPLSQGKFACALLKAAKDAGLNTCVETSGFCSEDTLEEAAAYTDLFLLDVKETDDARHKQFTGVDREKILRNARRLASLQKPIILRCPVIPGCNDREEHFRQIAALAADLGTVREIHLEPYHPFGVDKYESLGLEPVYANRVFMPGEQSEKWQKLLQSCTDIPVVIS